MKLNSSNLTSSDDCLMLLESPQAKSIVIGKGGAIVFAGVTAKRDARVRSMQLLLDNENPIDIPCGYARDELGGEDNALHSALQIFSDTATRSKIERLSIESGGFWYAHPMRHARRYSYRIRATYSDGSSVDSVPLTVTANIDYTTHFAGDVGQVQRQLADTLSDNNADTVICLASYQPDPNRIVRQLDSIQRQRYQDWVCLICDDASDPDALDCVQRMCQQDQRFILITHSDNLGFYRNFERALHYVPTTASFIALSDQDDVWYPDKLESLINNLTHRADSASVTDTQSLLCYSDMRVVDDKGSVISESYWSGRRNNYQDADVVMLANTVTGAASVIRQELLSTALPFPDPIGDAFHDHWLACCALSYGPMGYIDRPLYDYYQYDDSVIGHCNFSSRSIAVSSGRLLTNLGRALIALIHPVRLAQTIKRSLIRRRAGGLAIHHQECRRLELVTSTLKLRVQQPTISAQRAWRLFGNGAQSGVRLIFKHLAIRLRGETTNHAEVRLGLGYLIDSLDRVRLRIKRVSERVAR